MNKSDLQSFIKNFFDQYYHRLSEIDDMLVEAPGIEREMWADNVDPNKEYKRWKLVHSTVTDEELDQLEIEIGIKFPMSFRVFLSTYFHCFEEGIGKNSFSERFQGVKHAWNPVLVKAGYLPFTWDEEFYFIRCIKLDAMPDEEQCGIYQIDHEVLFEFNEDTVNKKEIDSHMEYISANFFSYLEEQLNLVSNLTD